MAETRIVKGRRRPRAIWKNEASTLRRQSVLKTGACFGRLGFGVGMNIGETDMFEGCYESVGFRHGYERNEQEKARTEGDDADATDREQFVGHFCTEFWECDL